MARAAELIYGQDDILSLYSIILQIAALAGESNDAEDLDYLLSSVDPRKKAARLLLLPAEDEEPAVMGFSAAVLLFEYALPFGLGRIFGESGVYAPVDLTGRRAVFAARVDRVHFAARAARFLIENGHAHIVHTAYAQLPDDPSSAIAIQRAFEPESNQSLGGFWSLAETKIRDYLLLGPTFEQTLARIGPRTRWNLRYYRRRTERDLGCTYIANAEVSLEEFIAFNRECSHAASDPRRRYEELRALKRPLFAGIQDRHGKWLALVGGRRRTREIEIDWQMNRQDLLLYSLSTVLRSALIEHEIKLGTTRLYINGGTSQRIGTYFVEEKLCELTVRRRSRYAGLLIRLIRWFQPDKNPVAEIVSNPSRVWQPW